MRLYCLVLLVFSLSLIAFTQPATAPRLGADATTMGYKEVTEWPMQVLNAAGTPGGSWNFIQVASVAIDAQESAVLVHYIAAPTPSWNSKATGGSCARGGTVCSVRARSAQ